MTLDEVQAELAKILLLDRSGDHEAAHEFEDDLMVRTIRAAAVEDENAAELARVVLEGVNHKRTRWYA